MSETKYSRSAISSSPPDLYFWVHFNASDVADLDGELDSHVTSMNQLATDELGCVAVIYSHLVDSALCAKMPRE